MKNFEIDKRVIIKIIDEFIDKYKNVSDINKKTIYEMILQGKEGEEGNMDDLEKLRKEYDPSLENDSGINNDIDKKDTKKYDIIEKNEIFNESKKCGK